MSPTAADETYPTPPVGRVVAVDALRGLVMACIMAGDGLHRAVLESSKLALGRVPAGLAHQLEHPRWEGFSTWDMIMPLFLFVVGVAMPYSMAGRGGDGRGATYGRALRRAGVLWVLGMIAQGNLLEFRLDRLRLYSNTLQAIAAGYLIATVALVELRRSWRLSAAVAGLLLTYWGCTSIVPPPGRFDPGANFALRVDRLALGRFRDGTTYTWVLGSLGFGASVLIGVLAGRLLRSGLSGPRKVAWLVGSGLILLAAGRAWSPWMPIIKHMWTGSMVLWAGGWSLILLGLLHGIIDVLGFRGWTYPLTVIGANAIVAYMADPLLDMRHIGQRLLGGLCVHLGAAAELGVACGTWGLLWLALWFLYKHRIFVRV